MSRPSERWMPVLAIVAAVTIAYANALDTPFLFDDTEITETESLHALSSATVLGTTRPLVQLSFALNWAVGGASPFGYHLVNVVVHALAALALYGIAARTVGTTGLPLAVALLWALHPLQTESVTYVIQRAESLMALCYLLTLYCVVRGAQAARGTPWYGAAVAACALGMLCKPVMATAPLLVLLYDRTFLAGGWRAAWRQRRTLYLGLFATWLLLALVLGGQEHESAATAGFTMRDVSLGEFVRSQPGVILRYLRLVLWPHGLVLDYGWPPATGAADVVGPALALAAGIACVLALGRGERAVGFLVAAFVILLAPSSSVVPIRDLAFEHRMYLPLAPLVALLAAGGWTLVRRAGLPEARERAVAATRARTVAAGIVGVLVVTLGALTIARNRDYRSPVAMWTDVTTKRPANPRAWSNLAQAANEAGDVDTGRAAAESALALDPSYADAHVHLAHALASSGDHRGAEAHAAEAVRLKPSSPDAHNNLGVALADQKRYAEAEPRYREALRLRPGYAEAKNNLGVAVMQRGAYDEAAALFADAIRTAPKYPEPESNLGNLRSREGRIPEAIAAYERALAIRPSYAEVHFNLAIALLQAGRRDEALAHARDALRLRPTLEPLVRQAGLMPAAR